MHIKIIPVFLFILLFSKSTLLEAREYFGHAKVLLTTNNQLYQILENYKFDSDQMLNIYFLKTVDNQLRRTEDFAFRFILLNENDDKFEAVIEVYKKSYSEISKLYSYNRKIEFRVEGTLAETNNFELQMENGDNLTVRLKIDKKFTLEEIKARFEQRVQGS